MRVDENGKVFKRWTVKRVDQLMNLLSGLPDRFEVCYEASCGHGTFHDLFRPIADRVVVAHPGTSTAWVTSPGKVRPSCVNC